MAATSITKLGIKAGVYKNGGTYGSPTWALMTLVKEATPGLANWAFADAAIRATQALLFAKTQVDLSTPLLMRADDADTAYVAMFDAAVSPTAVVDLLILDGLITVEGARGIRAEFLVGADPQNQAIDGVIYTQFMLKPTSSANGYPKSVVMGAASAPTFTGF